MTALTGAQWSATMSRDGEMIGGKPELEMARATERTLEVHLATRVRPGETDAWPNGPRITGSRYRVGLTGMET